MADHTLTIQNSMNLFGGGPPSLWNSHNWGEFNWGDGTVEIPHAIFKFIDNTTTLTDTLNKISTKLISNNQSFTTSMPVQSLKDAQGYNYLFTKPTIDSEERANTSWDDANIGDVATWVCQAAGSTTWT